MRYSGKSVRSKIIAAAAAAVMLAANVPVFVYAEDAAPVDPIASLEIRQAELAEEKAALEETIQKYVNNAEKQDEYLELYNRKMAVQEEEMENISRQVDIINEQLKELDRKIQEKQIQVDDGIEQFRERLRAMYMAGNDGIAEVIAGSANFYDMLARMEFVERVSKHDSEMISELVGKVQELDADKTSLETQRTELGLKRAERQAVLDDLRVTYANHEETKVWYENQAAAHEERTVEIEEEEARVEEELQDHIRKQQAEVAERMAEKRKKQEEARKKRDERRRQKEEEFRKAEEEKRRKEEEKAALTETTAAVTEVTPYELETYYEETTPAGSEFEYTVTTVTTTAVTEDEFEDVTDVIEEENTETTVTTAVTETTTAVSEATAADETTETTAGGSSDGFYDPYNDHEWGKTYTFDDDEDIYDGDKGYGTYDYTGFIWPVPSVRNITDGYGGRYIEEEGSSSFHKGIDINKPNCKGEPIVASAGGVVITASNTGNGYGIHVVIDHGDGIATLYGHMSSAAVSVGDEVQQGQVIGYIGNTGYAYGYHCHFEVRVDGQHTDPMKYVSMDN